MLFNYSLSPSLSDYCPQPMELPLPSPGLLCCPVQNQSLRLSFRDSVCMLLVTLLLRLQRARGHLGVVSCRRLFCVLSLFLKVIVEDGIGNHFGFQAPFWIRKDFAWPLASRHKTGGGTWLLLHLEVDLFPNPAGVLLPLLLPVEVYIWLTGMQEPRRRWRLTAILC